MIIVQKGETVLFRCKECGCCFREAVNKTQIKDLGVWIPERNETGTRAKCPQCGNDAIGYLEKENEINL